MSHEWVECPKEQLTYESVAEILQTFYKATRHPDQLEFQFRFSEPSGTDIEAPAPSR